MCAVATNRVRRGFLIRPGGGRQGSRRAVPCRSESRIAFASRSRRASDPTSAKREWEWECRRGAPHPRTAKTRTPQAQSAERRKRARRAGAAEPEASAVEGRARGSRRLAALSVSHSPSPRVVSSMAHGVAWGVFASRHGTRQRGTARPHERDPTACACAEPPRDLCASCSVRASLAVALAGAASCAHGAACVLPAAGSRRRARGPVPSKFQCAMDGPCYGPWSGYGFIMRIIHLPRHTATSMPPVHAAAARHHPPTNHHHHLPARCCRRSLRYLVHVDTDCSRPSLV